jgi:hypothetical protein
MTPFANVFLNMLIDEKVYGETIPFGSIKQTDRDHLSMTKLE